jgi:hypothetical protein
VRLDRHVPPREPRARPVEITASIPGSATHARSCAATASRSSAGSSAPPAHAPPRDPRLERVARRSVPGVRVSDTVRSAMRTGWKGQGSSIRDMGVLQGGRAAAPGARGGPAQASRLAPGFRRR